MAGRPRSRAHREKVLIVAQVPSEVRDALHARARANGKAVSDVIRAGISAALALYAQDENG